MFESYFNLMFLMAGTSYSFYT